MKHTAEFGETIHPLPFMVANYTYIITNCHMIPKHTLLMTKHTHNLRRDAKIPQLFAEEDERRN